MEQVRTNKRLLFLAALLAIGGVLLSVGFFARQGECYAKCSPVMGVMNYSYFSNLFQNIVGDRFIAQFKLYVLSELNIEFMPGNFIRTLMGDMDDITDFSSITGSVIDKGLASQMDYVKNRMSAEAFAGYLNNAVRAAAREELLKRGLDGRQVQGIVNDYERKFLSSRQAQGAYSDQVQYFQTMAKEFIPVSSTLASGMAGMAGKIDVAEWVQGKQGTGGNANTREMLKERERHALNGLKNIAVIAGIDIGDAIGGAFCSTNAQYLKDKLEKIRDLDGKVSLSGEDIEKIIANINVAAVRTVPDYLALATGALGDMMSRANTELNVKMENAIGLADSIIKKAMLLEKEKEHTVNRFYAGIQKEVKGFIDDKKQWEATAGKKKQISLLNEESIKSILILLAGRNSSIMQKRLAVKHYIVARESLDMSAAIRARLLRFDPAAIDRNYEDMAWKDLVRLNYLLLVIANQQLKLLALRAMTESFSTGDPVVARYVKEKGLPQDF